MGREIRLVPENWEHPKTVTGEYIPLFEGYECSLNEWGKEGCYWDRPLKESYVEYKDADGVWYQMYETVSEGTPVTPAFKTKDELVEYLCTKGTFWSEDKWSKENAIKFVGVGYMPSGIISGGRYLSGQDIMSVTEDE